MRFTEDEALYRAKVLRIISGTEAEVFFIDYGNSDICSGKNVKMRIAKNENEKW